MDEGKKVETLIMQLENSQHKVMTSYESIDLLSVQITRDDLNTMLKTLKQILNK